MAVPLKRRMRRPGKGIHIMRYVFLHSGGAKRGSSVVFSAGEGPGPGAGSDESVLSAPKHSQVSVPDCSAIRAVGAAGSSGTEGTSANIFEPAGATRGV